MEDELISLAIHRLTRAGEDLIASEVLLNNKNFAQSINRSYYAIFQATRALLAFDRFDARKHSSIIAYFGQNYVANQKIDNRFHTILMGAFKIRNKCDYDDFFIVSREEAEEQYGNAKEFVKRIESIIIKDIT
jgi:uncharacterized protein (UPF0332 family)